MKGIMGLCSFENFRYSPTFWLLNGDMHTLLPVLFRPIHSPSCEFRHLRLKIADGDIQPVDVAIPSRTSASETPSSKLLLLILAGVGGDTRQAYIADLCKKASEAGHVCAVVLPKGLMGDEVESVKRIFSPCDLDSLERTVKIICETAQSASLKVVTVGFSMGAILWLSYHSKRACPQNIVGCVSVGSAMKLDFSIFGRYPEVIQPAIVPELISDVMSKYGQEILKLIGQEGVSKLCRSRTFKDLHRNLLSKIGKSDEGNLWTWLEKQEAWRSKISVPTLIFHAKDDPMHIIEQCGYEKTTPANANVAYFLTQAGGHVGWCEGMSLRSTSYMTTVILRFSRACKCQHDQQQGSSSSWKEAASQLQEELEDRRMELLARGRTNAFVLGAILCASSIICFLRFSSFKEYNQPAPVKNIIIVTLMAMFADVCWSWLGATSSLRKISSFSTRSGNSDTCR